MELKELASAFAAKLGINGLAAEDGACALEIDGIPLQITETAAGGALLATAVVGPPRARRNSPMWRRFSPEISAFRPNQSAPRPTTTSSNRVSAAV